MRGVFVSNVFLKGEKFDEPPAMFGETAERAGVGLDILTNSDLTFPIWDGDSAERVLGEFRSNATLGGSVSAYEPTEEEKELAASACEAVGADFAGVDIIRTREGPVVCEVNSNAHLKNLLDCAGIDASEAILAHVIGTVRG